MKHKTKNMLRAMTKQVGLKAKIVNYLGDDVHGVLLPREKRILINANKPRNEHIYTLLHEIGHFLIHFKNLPTKHHPRFLDIHWETAWLARLCSKVRRYLRFIFNKQSGKEWEADLWAMCAFIYFAKRIGCRDELRVFLGRHPEKFKMFLLAGYGIAYCDTKTRIKKIGHALAIPFQALRIA